MRRRLDKANPVGLHTLLGTEQLHPKSGKPEQVMTEQEWRECTDTGAMLRFLDGRTDQRKLQRVAAVCCRIVWDSLSNRKYRKLARTFERFTEGLLSEQALNQVRRDLRAPQSRICLGRGPRRHLRVLPHACPPCSSAIRQGSAAPWRVMN